MPTITASAITATATASAATVQKGVSIGIPNSQKNPYLKNSSFKQGTFYVIILPIIGGIVLLYLIGVLINKLRANRLAKNIEPFDREYEYNLDLTDEDDDDLNNGNCRDHSEAANPFSDRYMTSNHSFTQNHKRNASSVDFISQYRRSMDHLAGLQDPVAPVNDAIAASSSFRGHTKNNKSIGSVLQLNLNEQTILKPVSSVDHNGQIIESPICYSPVNSYAFPNTEGDTGTDTSNYVDAINTDNRVRANTGTTSYYSIPEPTKAATQSVITPANTKTHGHTRTLSSHLLDAFISTGELPMLNENARTAEDVRKHQELQQLQQQNTHSHNQLMHSPNHSKHDINVAPIINIEHHSMFENTNVNAYGIPGTNIRDSSASSNPSSPRRARGYRQQQSTRDSWSRGSSRSPVRSPTRTPSPAKSPTRGAFGII